MVNSSLISSPFLYPLCTLYVPLPSLTLPLTSLIHCVYPLPSLTLLLTSLTHCVYPFPPLCTPYPLSSSFSLLIDVIQSRSIIDTDIKDTDRIVSFQDTPQVHGNQSQYNTNHIIITIIIINRML